MSILTLQLGQCGNQIGHTLFSYLYNDIVRETKFDGTKRNDEYIFEAKERWFREKSKERLIARTILIDTEEKVVQSIQQKAKKYEYNNYLIQSGGGGAGNNWACGYNEISKSLIKQVLENIRRELEFCDSVTGILALLSSSGGTGSGVGSRILQKVRDEYSTKTIVSSIILPYSNGEIVTQSYNTVLTLSKLYDVVDMCILFQNDQLQRMAEKLINVQEFQFKDCNDLIVKKLAGVLQPAEKMKICDIADHLVTHPSYKLVNIKSSPHISKSLVRYESLPKWSALMAHAKQMLRSSTNFDWEIKYAPTSYKTKFDYSVSLSNMLITRGKIEGDYIKTDMLRESEIYANWVPTELRFQHKHEGRRLFDLNNFFTLLTNNSSVYRQIEGIVNYAWNMYSFNANIHHYAKYGVDKQDFLDSFGRMETVIKKYKDLTVP